MAHACKLSHKDSASSLFKDAKSKLRTRLLKNVLISETNPLSTKYFRSQLTIHKEKKRQMENGYQYVIHPFSNLRQYYDKWLLFFYLLILFVKPLDACIKWRSFTCMNALKALSTVTDFLTWIDIGMNFCTGYYVESTKSVELDLKRISKKYVLGYFLIDCLGSFPMFIMPFTPPLKVSGILKIFCLLRGIRIISVIQLWLRLFSFMKYKTKTIIICVSNIFVFVLHFSTCLLMSVTWIVRVDFGYGTEEDSQLKNEINPALYNDYLFRSSAYLLGILLPPHYFKVMHLPEECFTTVIVYIVGKFLVVTTWIILVLTMLSARYMNIKFQKVMNQLESYMIHRELPMELRERVTQHYEYKYRGNYFKIDFLRFYLTGGLKRDIDYELCRTLINVVPILKQLSLDEITEVVQVLVPEIILPGDLIIQAGTFGDCLYFLSSGTVAVYTRSGREIRHLQDGAYFGELALVLKTKSRRREATVMAVEISQIYKMRKFDFRRILAKNKEVISEIAASAEQRLKEILHHEEIQKRYMLSLNVPNLSLNVPNVNI